MCFLCECVFTTFFEEKKMSGLGCCERKVDVITLGMYGSQVKYGIDNNNFRTNLRNNFSKKYFFFFHHKFDLTFI